ncbi:substrate-binding domain-containing protein [Actinomyces provencensis]|uniref:substrate-binding domain-containing protein n=1 Tax=Actinomyces provencensis TaxID=1720198 RepID=UPI00096AA09C|nr:sugar-binding protein [Actinomyces provencensis]
MGTRRSVLGTVLALALALSTTLTGCTSARSGAGPRAQGESGDSPSISIGVALPQKTSQNWVEAESLFAEDCQESGVSCTVRFANSGVSDQQNQISAMIQEGVDALVIGAVDGSQLGTQLAQARAAGITVIAYDRMITNTPDVDYYIAYDSFGVGRMQGESLLEGLGERAGAPPWRVELFAGSPADANSMAFYRGAMDVLGPRIDDGTLVVGSGQVAFTQVATQGWLAQNAQNRMATLLASSYRGDAVLAGVLSPNDALARAIITGVVQAGKPIPVVTGLDSEDESVTWVVQGKQYSTIFKDTRSLVRGAVDLAISARGGEPLPSIPDTNLDTTGNESQSGHIVPSYLLTPQIVTAANAESVFAGDSRRVLLVEEARQ